MDNAVFVAAGERGADFVVEAENFVWRRGAGRETIGKGVSFAYEVHDKIGIPVLVCSAVRDADDIGVANYRGELCFGEELLCEDVAVCGICDIEDLDGVFGLPRVVDGLEDSPHSAAPYLAYDVILSDLPHRNYYSKFCHGPGCRSYVCMDRAARRRARGNTRCVFRVSCGIMRAWESAGRNPRDPEVASPRRKTST